jgi:hypothetical protein
MRSVSAPVVARPYQFVLLDRHGAVAFEQTQGSFRGERFFESVRGGDALRLAAARDSRAGVPPPDTYQYRGKSYRMIGVDVPELGLTLVTAYEVAVVSGLAAQMFSTAGSFTLGIILAVLIGAVIAAAAFDDMAFDWAWPSTTRTVHYLVGLAVIVLVMLLLLLARSILPAHWLSWLMLAIPMGVVILLGSGYLTTAISWAVMRLAPGTADQPRGSLRLLSLTYTCFAVTALLAFVAWPALIVFDDAFNLYSTEYEQQVSDHWTVARDQWSAANRTTLVDTGQSQAQPDWCRKPYPRCTAADRIARRMSAAAPTAGPHRLSASPRASDGGSPVSARRTWNAAETCYASTGHSRGPSPRRCGTAFSGRHGFWRGCCSYRLRCGASRTPSRGTCSVSA